MKRVLSILLSFVMIFGVVISTRAAELFEGDPTCEHSYYIAMKKDRTFTDGEMIMYVCSYCFRMYDSFTTPYRHLMKGDLNGDDKNNAVDSNIMDKIILGSIETNIQNMESGDLDGDAKINAIDTNMLKKAILGEIVLVPSYEGEIIEEGENVEYHTDLQLEYINYSRASRADRFANGTEEKSIPKPITLDFSKDGLDESYYYVIEIASKSDFSDSILRETTEKSSYEYYNPVAGQDLYFRAATNKGSLVSSPIHHLTVSSVVPRVLYVDGVTNVRDIGGYNSYLAENGKIRQGLFYRGANLNTITDAGKTEMYDHLGVRVEIDLRDSYQCLGPYIEGVDYNAISIPSGTESTRFEKFEEEYYKIFTLISNADKNPIYLHCTAGADRTGITCFMLLTVCGVDYTDLVYDYLFTNFSTHGARQLSNEFNKWYYKLEEYYEGDTYAERAKNWLLSKGIEEEKIEKIRSIFIENYTSEK